MNYYERYCGDYARDTAHLSLEQNGAYTVMLDAQYSSERGLPADYDGLYRICRAMSKSEQASVRFIAEEFFPVGADGLRWNKRAVKELDKARRRIYSAQINGKRGGRPRTTHWDNESEPEDEPNSKPEENPVGFQRDSGTEPIGAIGESTTRHAPHAIPQAPPQRQNLTPPLGDGRGEGAGEETYFSSPAAPNRQAKKEKKINGVGHAGISHGTRLTQPWDLPEPWLRWALNLRPDWDEERTLRESLVFRDHWYAKPGKDGRKADWQATWRNWVRRAT